MSPAARQRKRTGGADLASRGALQCKDGLLWIGQSYVKFDCGSKKSCAIPSRPLKARHCFVHEAERRGVSRKVPHIPVWAVPGTTRVFLAHSAGLKDAGRGRIFGYFVLDRVEVLHKPGKPAVPSPRPPQKPIPGPVVIAPEGTGDAERPQPPGQRGKKQPASQQGKENGSEFLKRLLEELLKEVFTDDEEFAEHRSCSLRLNHGAIYLVDALSAEITDTFSRRLNRTRIKERYKAARGKRRERLTSEGRELFNAIADAATTPDATIPPALKGKSYVRGPLVLFKDPPLLERCPKAAFRSLERIDGDDLIKQICDGITRPGIRTVCREGPETMTKQEIVGTFAERLRVNQAFASEFLDELAKLAKDELDRGRAFRLPRLGTFRRTKGKVKVTPSTSLYRKPGRRSRKAGAGRRA